MKRVLHGGHTRRRPHVCGACGFVGDEAQVMRHMETCQAKAARHSVIGREHIPAPIRRPKGLRLEDHLASRT